MQRIARRLPRSGVCCTIALPSPTPPPAQLIASFGARGLAVLGTPCAQFANQEAAGNGEIMNTLQYVRPGNGFVPSFPLTQKLLVNGVGAHPLWVYARASCPAPGLEIADNLPLWLPITSRDVNWNFVRGRAERGWDTGRVVRSARSRRLTRGITRPHSPLCPLATARRKRSCSPAPGSPSSATRRPSTRCCTRRTSLRSCRVRRPPSNAAAAVGERERTVSEGTPRAASA